jgi:hypothetical protein
MVDLKSELGTYTQDELDVDPVSLIVLSYDAY